MSAGPDPAIRVLVVDDHPIWREGTARYLSEAGYTIAGTAGDGAQALRIIAATRPDVVLLDLNLPDESGAEVARRLLTAQPSVRVLMLSASGAQQDVLDAVTAGAVGYVLKSAQLTELVDAVRSAAAGHPVFTPALAGLVLGEYRRLVRTGGPSPAASEDTGSVEPGVSPRLTERETEILRLVAKGLTYPQIAQRLTLSTRTVQNHVRNTLTKLQLHNKAQLVRYALENGADLLSERNTVESQAVTGYISVPFYDLGHERRIVPGIRASLQPLLAGVRRSILEIGAGTGLITVSLADLTPGEIFALEPSADMRAVLLSRLSSRPELLSRVTVLPGDALSVRLDEPAQAVVMINVLQALEPDYRRRLWPVLAASLEPAGLLVFTWHDGGRPTPGQRIETHQVGRHTYTVLSEILESDEESRRLRYVYRITEGEKVISEEELTGRAYWPTRNALRRELTDAGFTQAEGAEGLLAWVLA